MLYYGMYDGSPFWLPSSADYAVINPKISKKENQPDTLEFSVEKNSARYKDFKPGINEIVVTIGKSFACVDDEDAEVFRGKITSISTDFYGRKLVKCESALGYLKHTAVKMRNNTSALSISSLFETVIEDHNDVCQRMGVTDEGIQFGNVSFTRTKKMHYPVGTAYDTIMQQFVSPYGGRLEVTRSNGKSRIYWKNSYRTNSQRIEFGKNLLSLDTKITADSIVTGVFPLGKALSGTTGEEAEYLNLEETTGLPYIWNQTAVDNYGLRVAVVRFNDCESASELQSLAQDYLTRNQYYTLGIEINAVDMSRMDTSIDAFDLGEQVRVVSVPHGLDANLPITSMDIYPLNPASDKFVLGKSYRGGLIGAIAKANSNTSKDLVTKLNAAQVRKLINEVT